MPAAGGIPSPRLQNARSPCGSGRRRSRSGDHPGNSVAWPVKARGSERQGGHMRPMTVGFRGAIVALALIASPAGAQFNIPTTITNLFGFGIPLDGILIEAAQGHSDDLATFADGQLTFTEVDSLPELGPIFNSRSCGACHFQPALGGSGQFINEVRVRNNTAGGPLHIFASDSILRAGPQKQGTTTIFPAGLESTPLGCQITSPRCT